MTENPDIVNLGFGDKININDNNKTFDIGILQNPETGKYYPVPFDSHIKFVGFLIKRK